MASSERRQRTSGLDPNRIYGALARFIVRFRWFVVVFWLLVAVATSATLPSLSTEVNNNNSSFLKKSEPSVKAGKLATPLLGAAVATGNSQLLTVVAETSKGKLDQGDLGAIRRELTLLNKVPKVTFAKLTRISADGRAAEIQANLAFSGSDIEQAGNTVDAVVATFHRIPAAGTLKFHVAGQVATAIASQKSSNKSSDKVQLVSFLFVIVLLLFVFRSLTAAILTLLPSGIALLISMRVIGAMGQAGIQISSITQVLLIVLMIGAGTDYGLFLVFRVREELRNGNTPHGAVEAALVKVGESVTGSAGTVILALLTLLFATFGLYHDLGLPLAVGVLIMLMIGLSLLPALLAIVGRKAFWPANVERGPQRDGAWGTIAKRLLKRPGLTLIAGVLVFLALAAAALGYKAGGFGGSTTAPKGSDAALGNAAIARHFPSSGFDPANLVLSYGDSVWQHPQRIVVAERSLARSGAFNSIASPLNPNGAAISVAQLTALHTRLGPPQALGASLTSKHGFTAAQINAYRADAQFISRAGTVIQYEVTLKAGPQPSTAAMHATPHIRAVLAAAGRASGARRTGVAGQAAAVYDINSAANHDLVKIVPIAIIAIGLLLALVLRSLIAPLYLIVSVGLSFLAALGIATILFIDLGGDGGITFVLPFLMFIFLLALGEDYNILVMTRIREEAARMPLKDAVIEAVARTGSTVTSAGIILGGTFAIFGIVGGSGSGGSQLRAIGFGLAAGILMDTFLVRTLLVPAVVTLLGRWNWWPSHMAGQEHHQRVQDIKIDRAEV